MVTNTTIKISQRLKEYLIKNSLNKTQSYEDVIWMLLGAKALTKEQKEEAKAEYEKCL
jgi:citrate synthase